MVPFSIIVPVFNVEKYLKECVESILEQTFPFFELILVDDGSNDNSGKMCDSYREKDNRITVVHKENGGLSSARNAGLEIAEGEYIIFVDSDDFWDDVDALKQINEHLSFCKTDVILFPIKRYYDELDRITLTINMTVDIDKTKTYRKQEVKRYLVENNLYRASACNKIIKKQLIDEYCLRFREGYLSEDVDWCGDILQYANTFDYFDKPFYCYRQQRTNSITSQKTEKLVIDKIYMCERGYQQVLNIKDGEEKSLLGSYYAYEYSVAIGISGKVKNRDVLQRIKKLQPLLEYDICRKVKKVNILMKILGFELTRKALCFFVKVKK